MEHLPVPKHSIHEEHKTVPYVCRNSYDGGPFLTYPIRENKPHVLPSASQTPGQLPYWQYEKLHPTPNEDLESFFQTWLFFGLINEILGNLCSPDDFIVSASGEASKSVSTSKLIDIAETWVFKVLNGEILTTYEHLAECLRLAYATLRAPGPTFNQRIKLSIASTGEVLEYAVNKAFQIENWARDNKCPGSWRPLVDAEWWTAAMRAAGWCPSQIRLLSEGTLSVQSSYYFTALPQPETPARHQSCNERKCSAYQNNLNKYTTQHCTADCDCEELSVDIEAIDDTLKHGSLPLLRILPGQTMTELTLEIVPSKSNSSYVALSHVWADGLGNPYANALPRCQLIRLHSLLQRSNIPSAQEETSEDLLLWCDTLCCPVKPEAAKNRALSQMKRTYQDASHVLVLDAALQMSASTPADPEEMCARIIASGWTRRLWTFQEGLLPAEQGKLWFQFQDRAFNIRPILFEIQQIFKNKICRRGLTGEIISRMINITTFSNYKYGSDVLGLDLVTIDAALRHRSVSEQTDEPLLIGNLLGMDVDKVLDGPKESRIHRMWSLMPSAYRGIPKSIIFRLGPRLQEQGFRWAPSSMSERYESSNSILRTMREGDNQGLPSSRGLQVSLSGYKLSFPKRPTGLPPNPWNINQDKKILYMRDADGAWYLIRRRDSTSSDLESDFLSDKPLSDIVRVNDDLSILDLETDFRARSDGVQQTRTSLLVKHTQEENGVNYVHSHMHVNVAILQRISVDMMEAAYQCARQLTQSAPAQALAGLQDEDVNFELPAYKTLFDALGSEIHRIAMMDGNEAGLTAARQYTGQDGTALFEALISLMFIGHYAHMGTRTSDTQRWCVD